jgi:leader peptidase (prepilin peptidase)/N-methyltransferase
MIVSASVGWVLPALLAAGGGAVSANQLRRQIYAMAVAPGEPDRSHCSHCSSRPFGRVPDVRGRCAHCDAQIGPRFAVVELAAALVACVAVLLLGPSIEAVGFASAGIIGVALAAIDIRSYRLPDRLIGIALVMLASTLGIATMLGGEYVRFLEAVGASVALCGAFLIIALIQPGQFGLGDVKLALLTGLALGWLGWQSVLLGACLAFVFSALSTLALLALRRISLRSHIAFGPFMLIGAAAALLR